MTKTVTGSYQPRANPFDDMLDKIIKTCDRCYNSPSPPTPPPPLAHAQPCLSTGWVLNRSFEEILGPLFLRSKMEDWVIVGRSYRERGAQSYTQLNWYCVNSMKIIVLRASRA